MIRNALTEGAPLHAFTGYRQFILTTTVWDESAKKYRKIPVDYRDGKTSDAHNPNIWLDASEAITKSEQMKLNVGFVFTENDPFYFLDIDNCLDSGGEWTDLAKTLISSLPGAAMEVSHSGQGLHVFGRTGKFDHSCKNIPLDIELYTEKRFVHLTGTGIVGDAATDNTTGLFNLASMYFKPKALENADGWTVEPVEGYGAEIEDKHVIAAGKAAVSAKNRFGVGVTFKDLWNRDVDRLSHVYPSQSGGEFDASSADMALASHLMFFTGGNCEQTERLMRASKLVREKWDSHASYLKQFTISRAYSMWVGDGQKCYTVPEKYKPEKPVPTEEEAGSGLLMGAGYEFYHIGFPSLKGNGKPKGTLENFLVIMDYFKILVRYNEMSKDCEVSIPGVKFLIDNERNNLLTLVTSICIQLEYPTENIDKYLDTYAAMNSYHPVQEWINSKPWDGTDRIDTLSASLDAENPELAKILLKKWLLSCVKGAYLREGVNTQGALVLQGAQNVGKTRWFLSLTDFNESISKQGAILNPNDKDSVKQSVGYWLVELGELDATFRKSDIAALKAFIDLKYDEFRAPYARKDSKYPRRTIFFASVNPREFLHDDTGNRRYWTVAVGPKLNTNHGVNMQQLWAQIKHMWDSGFKDHWLTKDENRMLNESNELFEASTVETDLIRSRYDMSGPRTRRMTTSEILLELGIDPTRSQTRQASPNIAKALGVAGTIKHRGRKVFLMPQKLPNR